MKVRRPGEILKKPTAEQVIERGAEASGEADDRMTVNVYLPRRALPVIDQAAGKMGIARSAWIRLAILEKLRRDGGQEW